MIIEQNIFDNIHGSDNQIRKTKTFKFTNLFSKLKSPPKDLKVEKSPKFSLRKLFRRKRKVENEFDHAEFATGYGE